MIVGLPSHPKACRIEETRTQAQMGTGAWTLHEGHSQITVTLQPPWQVSCQVGPFVNASKKPTARESSTVVDSRKPSRV